MRTDLREEYLKKKNEVEARLRDFKNVRGDDIFYELCFCLLTPQSNAFKSDEKIQILKQEGFLHKNLDPHPIIKDLRFHNHRNEYLKELKRNYTEIKTILGNGHKSEELRDILIEKVKGISLKESSHFLRNIGHRDLAILDRHILKHLARLKVIDKIPKTLTRKRYLDIEQKFKDYSRKVNIPMDHLDLLFWSMETGKIFK